jgi:hypothetical protein
LAETLEKRYATSKTQLQEKLKNRIQEGLLVIPFAALYVLGEINFVPLTASNLLIISSVLLFIDILLFLASKSTFRREEILIKWN